MTLKRLASVQEQRIHPGAPIDVSLSPTPSEIARLPTGSDTGPESSLDDLLDALQNYSEGSNPDSLASEPPEQEKSNTGTVTSGSETEAAAEEAPRAGTGVATTTAAPKQNLLKAPPSRLPSYPSTEHGGEPGSPIRAAAPPCPPRTVAKGAPPPPPPRTSSAGSRSRAVRETAALSPAYLNTVEVVEHTAASSLARTLTADPEPQGSPARSNGGPHEPCQLSHSESSSSDSAASQDAGSGPAVRRSSSLGAWAGQGPPPVPTKPEAIKNLNSKKRQDELEQRHQELLARQKQLQVSRKYTLHPSPLLALVGAVPAVAEHATEGEQPHCLHRLHHQGFHPSHEEDWQRLQPHQQ